MEGRSVKKTLLTATLLLMSASGFAQADETRSADERESRMQWWRDARFGMFVHWGLYSIAEGEWPPGTEARGAGEWLQRNADIPADVYERTLVPQFKPKADFAEEWAKTAKMAGCRYLVFTSKHHDGFALHDSKQTTYDAKDASGRDLFKEIVDATRAEGLKVGAYHSVIDWHHPHAYAGFGLPTVKGVTNEGRDNSIYVDYLHKQVEEIVSGYGPIDILWWDFSKPECEGESWRAKELMAMVRRHQPQIVMNNRLYSTQAGATKGGEKLLAEFDTSRGDFTTPEQHIPDVGRPGVDWETCMTMNKTWGYKKSDQQWKPADELIRNLVDIVSKGGNYLLNVGPLADGTIPPESIDRMKAIGQWMDVNGEAIYGSSASPFDRPEWGRYTIKSGTLFAHVFEWPSSGELMVAAGDQKIAKAYLLADESRKALPMKPTENGVIVSLPANAPDPVVSVVVLEYEGAKN